MFGLGPEQLYLAAYWGPRAVEPPEIGGLVADTMSEISRVTPGFEGWEVSLRGHFRPLEEAISSGKLVKELHRQLKDRGPDGGNLLMLSSTGRPLPPIAAMWVLGSVSEYVPNVFLLNLSRPEQEFDTAEAVALARVVESHVMPDWMIVTSKRIENLLKADAPEVPARSPRPGLLTYLCRATGFSGLRTQPLLELGRGVALAAPDPPASSADDWLLDAARRMRASLAS
ncbi:hypothetical protein [Kineosporia sp. A_224]|uniref:hypothetical protein n=1 Tax=Kineosporia sp. A_224 TaxID=1962180 RepID=UPI000B4AB36E|nr:hypothetical protein [Kineosporia sp. A_224]